MTAQSTTSIQGPDRLGIAFAMALALHVGVMATLMLWPTRETLRPPGEQEVTIDLAPAMQMAEAISPAESASLAETVEAKQQPPEPEVMDTLPPEEATETIEPEKMTEAVPGAPEAVAAVSAEEAVIARPVEEKPAPKAVKPPRSKPLGRKTVSPNPQQGRPSASQENTNGSAASADPNELNRYRASLVSALRSRLRYPSIASAQGISGVATLQFTMERSGRILSASLVRSAGHPALDQAALDAARPGSFLPAAPSSISQQQFTFLVPLRFNLR